MTESISNLWAMSPIIAIGAIITFIFQFGNWKESTKKKGTAVGIIIAIIGVFCFFGSL